MTTILVDTREKTPWDFPSARVQRKALGYGDYCLYGQRSGLVIERKTPSDLFHTLTRGTERFEKEMAGLRDCCKYPVVIVEAYQESIKAGVWSSSANGGRVLDHFMRTCMLFRVGMVFCRGTLEAQDTAWRMLRGWSEISQRRP